MLHIVVHIRDVPTVVGTNHHSDKAATTTNSLTSTKISTWMKMLSLIANCFTQHMCMYVYSVYKNFPRHCLSIENKDHKLWRFKTHLYNHHSSKPVHNPAYVHNNMLTPSVGHKLLAVLMEWVPSNQSLPEDLLTVHIFNGKAENILYYSYY